MNIFLLNWRDPSNPRAGGAEYVTHEHAKGWVRLGNAVTWFTSGYPGSKREEWIDGVRIVRRGNAGSVFFHAVAYYFSHRKDIDLIVDEVHGIPFFAAVYARVPVILFIHEVAGSIWGIMYGSIIGWIGNLSEKIFLWIYRASPIWTDAESTVRELVNLGVPADHCTAIPCPISQMPRKRMPVKGKSLTCIFVGRLVRMKRVEHLLVAFADILHTMPEARFFIVGDGDASYVGLLKKHAISLGIADSVIWYGRVTEEKKLSLLASSHVLLHASVKEGWGLVVLEAGSQWTPSVVYGVGGLVDVVKDGETGCIVPTCNPHDMAQKVLHVFADKRIFAKMQKHVSLWSGSFRWDDAIQKSHTLLMNAYEAQK